MSNFRELSRARFQDQVLGAVPKDRWYSLVVDEAGLRVVSSHLQLSELLDYNVSVVEPLAKTRKPARDGIYFVAPVRASVQRLCEDFSAKGALYENAYVFLSSKAPESVKNLIKGCPQLVQRLRVLKEVHMEYESVEERTFVTSQPGAFKALYGPEQPAELRRAMLDQCAQRLCTVFATLKSRPASIVVRTPQDLPELGLGDTAQRKGLCQDLGRIVQDRLSRWATYDPALFTAAACDLLIVDRGHDAVAPAIHPFHYAAIAHDLADIRGGVFRYQWKDAKGQAQTSEHLVDASDATWAEMRHAHIADVGSAASSRLKEFANSKLARVEREGAQAANLSKATAGLPEYLQQKAHLSMHFELTRAVFAEISRRDLYPLGKLEQELVFDERRSNDMQKLMSDWNLKRSDGSPTVADKMRLLLCYLATHPGRFDQQSRERWAQLAQLSARDLEALCNVQYLGVELQKAKRSKFRFMGGRSSAKKARVARADDSQLLENGRFQPAIADAVQKLTSGRLDKSEGDEWAAIEADTEFDAVADAASSQAASMGAKSMRTTKKPTWHRRGASSTGSAAGGGVLSAAGVGLQSRVVVVFIIGGCTWSEIQAAHECSTGVDIVLGSTRLIENGEDFLQDLASLSAGGSAAGGPRISNE